MPRRSLGRASLVLLGGSWTHGALSLLISIVIGRVLGPSAVGELALNLGLAGLVMAVLLPGFARAHLKRLAEGQDAGRCIGTMLLIQGVLTAVLVAAMLAARRTGALPGSGSNGVLLAMVAAQAAGKLAEVFLLVLIAREWVVVHGAVLIAARLVRLVTTVAVLATVPSLPWIAATFVVESLLAGIVAAGVLAAKGVTPRAPTLGSLADYWRYARPFLVMTPLALVQDSIDRVLVGRWAGLAAAGYYHVARGLWEALAGVMAPPTLLLFTRLSSLYAERSPERDRKARVLFFSGLDKLLFVATALAIAFWALAGPAITVLYGDSFAPASPALRILVVATLMAALVDPYTFVLQAQDEVARFVPVNILRFVVYLAALALLVPGLVPGLPAGDGGAALARLLLIVFPAWVWVGWTRDLAGIPFYSRATVYLGGFGLAVATFHLADRLVASAVAPALAADLIGVAAAFSVYALWLLKLHPDTRANVAYTVGLLAPGVARRLGQEPRRGLTPPSRAARRRRSST
jgi:O-antigen/teichoic acid export membrane protein